MSYWIFIHHQDTNSSLWFSIELETFRADVSESRAKLQRLEEKLAEIESQKQEVSVAIAQAQHIAHIQQESTSAEVFRLKGAMARSCC